MRTGALTGCGVAGEARARGRFGFPTATGNRLDKRPSGARAASTMRSTCSASAVAGLVTLPDALPLLRPAITPANA